MKHIIVSSILCLLVCGCISQQSDTIGLTTAERNVLKTYYSSPDTVEQAARICLRRRLSKAEVLSHTSDAMRREVADDSITFFFAPSQWWKITFDQDGNTIEVEITGKKITKETPTTTSIGIRQPARGLTKP